MLGTHRQQVGHRLGVPISDTFSAMANRIREFRKAKEWSLQALAERAGTTRQQIDKLEKGERRLTQEWMERLAAALGCKPADLIDQSAPPPVSVPEIVPPPSGPLRPDYGPTEVNTDRIVPIPAISQMPKDVPVYGVAVGGDDADFEFNGQIVDYVRRPPGLIGVQGAFGVYVIGTSMWPRYEEGDLVYVHPGRPARPGDDVIVEMYDDRDEGRSGDCYIKRLLKKTPTKYICQQYNPMRDDLEYEIDYVKKVHRIMTPAELMSA